MAKLSAAVAMVAAALAAASWRESSALRERVGQLDGEVAALAARLERAERPANVMQRTVVERHIVATGTGERSDTSPPREPSAAERFEEDTSRDPRRRTELVQVMRNASLDVESIDCNQTTCALVAAPAIEDVGRFVEAATDAIGPGVRMEMVYDEPIGGRQRVVIYAR